MSNDDWFARLRDSFRNIGEAFEAVEGARVIPSFASTSEEEYIPDPEQREENERLDPTHTWVRQAESKPSDTFPREFLYSQSGFSPICFVDGSVRSVKALDGIAMGLSGRGS